MSLVRNVTAENYQEIGNSFIELNGSKMIALVNGRWGGAEFEATPRQWGAWCAYFRNRKIPTRFMAARGQDSKPWTVPAEWPHLFDAEATIQADQHAADLFMRGYRPPRPDLKRALDAELRKAAVKRIRYGSQFQQAAE